MKRNTLKAMYSGLCMSRGLVSLYTSGGATKKQESVRLG